MYCTAVHVKKICELSMSSDLIDLWVIKIKTHNPLRTYTSRSREQSTKRKSRSENMRKVCLFYNQNTVEPLLSDHLTKIPIGSSVSQIAISELPVSDHLS